MRRKPLGYPSHFYLSINIFHHIKKAAKLMTTVQLKTIYLPYILSIAQVKIKKQTVFYANMQVQYSHVKFWRWSYV